MYKTIYSDEIKKKYCPLLDRKIDNKYFFLFYLKNRGGAETRGVMPRGSRAAAASAQVSTQRNRLLKKNTTVFSVYFLFTFLSNGLYRQRI